MFYNKNDKHYLNPDVSYGDLMKAKEELHFVMSSNYQGVAPQKIIKYIKTKKCGYKLFEYLFPYTYTPGENGYNVSVTKYTPKAKRYKGKWVVWHMKRGLVNECCTHCHVCCDDNNEPGFCNTQACAGNCPFYNFYHEFLSDDWEVDAPCVPNRKPLEGDAFRNAE